MNANTQTTALTFESVMAVLQEVAGRQEENAKKTSEIDRIVK